MTQFVVVPYKSDITHHGIKGQKWGSRNGPPYPLKGGAYSEAEKKQMDKPVNKTVAKKQADSVVEKGTTITTLSYDKNRTKKDDMFYGTTNQADNDLYTTFFNKKLPEPIYDEKGKPLGTSDGYKFRIHNKAKTDINVAGEDSGAEAFKKLYSKDRDFYNFVTDPERMEGMFVTEKYKYKGYREAKDALDKIRSDPSNVTGDDLKTAYRMFNYVLPYSGDGPTGRMTNDIRTNRAKFFKELGEQGFGAVLDTNDALYGSFHADSPVIVFDMSKVTPKNFEETDVTDKYFAALATAGRKFVNGL